MFKPSIFCFVVTALVFALQVFPLTGIFMMLFLAMFWSVITINAGFLFMIAEAAWWKMSPRWTLVFPALYFGGYFLFVATHNFKIYQADYDIPRVAIQFDPDKQILSVPKVFAESFLVKYGLEEVLSSHPSHSGMEGYQKTIPRETLVRLGDREQCEAMRDYGYSKGTFFMRINISDGKGGYKPIEDKCIYGIPLHSEPLEKEIVLIEQDKTRRKPADVRLIDERPIIVTTPDGRVTEISAGYAIMYPWFPVPILGCSLISSSPEWKCHTAFHRYAPKPIGYGHVDKLAETLGLIPQDEKAVLNRKAAKVEIRRIVDDYNDPRRRFERIIANPCNAQIPDKVFPMVLADRNYVSSNKEKILDAYIRATREYSLTCEAKNRNLRRALTPFIVGLSDQDYKSLSGKLVDYFAQEGSDFENRYYGYEKMMREDFHMLVRFGDLGEPAYETLLDMLEKSLGRIEPWKTPTALYYAICRAGPGITEGKRARVLLIRALKRVKRYKVAQREALRDAHYAAFMRLGLESDYSQYLDPSQHVSAQDRPIGPSSPPSTCFDLNKKD